MAEEHRAFCSPCSEMINKFLPPVNVLMLVLTLYCLIFDNRLSRVTNHCCCVGTLTYYISKKSCPFYIATHCIDMHINKSSWTYLEKLRQVHFVIHLCIVEMRLSRFSNENIYGLFQSYSSNISK